MTLDEPTGFSRGEVCLLRRLRPYGEIRSGISDASPANARTTTKDIDSGFKQRVRGFFNALADDRASYRNRCYHEQLLRHFRFIIPPASDWERLVAPAAR